MSNYQDTDRFKHLVHYVLWYFKHYLQNSKLGYVKLNKILWILDAYSRCNAGRSLSGESYYIKRRWGPVPPKILATMEALHQEGTIISDAFPPSPDSCKVGKPPEQGVFNTEELRQIRTYCRKLADYTGGKLSRFSHDQIYDAYEEGERIPLTMYLVREVCEPGAESIAARDRLLQEIQASRSN